VHGARAEGVYGLTLGSEGFVTDSLQLRVRRGLKSTVFVELQSAGLC
jgi:hypothetical protein